MSTVVNDHSSNTARYDRNVIATGTGAVAPNFYKARVHWVDSVITPGELVPPQDASVTTWVIAAP